MTDATKVFINLPKIRRSNIAMINDIMNFSSFGALSQVMVVEALRHYTAAIINAPAPTEDPKEGRLISSRAWYQCARDIQERLVDNFETPNGNNNRPEESKG